MPNFLQIESESERLRQALRLAPSPELETVCILKFFSGLKDELPGLVEPYFKEFIPKLTVASQKADPREFLPADAAQLSGLLEFLGGLPAGICSSDDLGHLQTLHRKISDYLRAVHNGELIAESDEKGNGVSLKALFVEHFPELGLDPRGRILTLRVSAEKISPRNETDDVDIRNPLLKSNDSFLKQARDSAAAARKYLEQSHNLPSRRRYRINFHVDHTGARFTGDSLGVAFAVGAVAAIARLEVLREKISVATDAVFSGALSAEGKILPIDAQGLKLKIFRAFHSGLKYLVIPRQHIDDCWGYLKELESPYPRRKLELYGVEELPSVLSDPRFVTRSKVSPVSYRARKTVQAVRNPKFEIPMLVVMLSLLAFFSVKLFTPIENDNPVRFHVDTDNKAIEFFNSGDTLLWTLEFPWTIPADHVQASNMNLYDLDDDGRNEVLILPEALERTPEYACFFCYSFDGELLFKRSCMIPNEYIVDTPYTVDAEHIRVFELDDEKIIVTTVCTQTPAGSHATFWTVDGDSLGWYINAGASWPCFADDFDSDGDLEIFFLNYNNPMGCAAVVVIDPDSAYGCSPPYTRTEYRDRSWLKRGTQVTYILFPQTDLSKEYSALPYNQPGKGGIWKTENGYAVNIREHGDAKYGAYDIVYHLDARLRVVQPVLNDPFRKLRDRGVSEGQLPNIPYERYVAHLLDTVTYWTDSGWVTEGQLRAAENLKKSSKISK
ncbi:MAG: hypothetical protein HRF51_09765 [bacterium]|jgi:hypothetical protein